MRDATVRTAVQSYDLLNFRRASFQRKLTAARLVVTDALCKARRPYVAFSGGKDSLVTLALVREQYPYCPVIWSDDEMEYAAQDTYIRTLAETWGLNLTVTLGHATHGGWFQPWRNQPSWREPWPEAQRINQLVEVWSDAQGYDLTFLGLRTQESTARRLWVGSKGRLYQTQRGYRCNPLLYWSVDDVWATIAGLGLPYNPVYDDLATAGIPRERQRVGPLPLTPGWILRLTYPGLWHALRERYGAEHWEG